MKNNGKFRHKVGVFIAFASQIPFSGLSAPMPKAVAVISEQEHFASSVVAVGEALYFTKFSNEGECRERNLFRIQSGKLEQLAELHCVTSLQAVDGKVFVQSQVAEEGDVKALGWQVLENDKLEPLETALPQFTAQIPLIRRKLFSVGNAAAPAHSGHWLRRATFASLQWDPSGKTDRWTALMHSPQRTAEYLPHFVIVSGVLSGKSEPVAKLVTRENGERIEAIRQGPFPYVYALMSGEFGEQRRHFFAVINSSTGEVEKKFFDGFNLAEQTDSPELFHSLRHLAVDGDGSAVFYDSGNLRTSPERVWSYHPEGKRVEALSIGARDITGLSSSPDGLLVSRRGGEFSG